MEASIERIEALENKVAELEKIISSLIKESIKPKHEASTGWADIYQYRNSLILVSLSKDWGTYHIKDKLKEIGAKWATVTDKNGNKFSGWMILGICKEYDMDIAIKSVVSQLSKIECTLTCNNKGKIDPVEVPITTQ
jgi:hypothetical protein